VCTSSRKELSNLTRSICKGFSLLVSSLFSIINCLELFPLHRLLFFKAQIWIYKTLRWNIYFILAYCMHIFGGQEKKSTIGIKNKTKLYTAYIKIALHYIRVKIRCSKNLALIFIWWTNTLNSSGFSTLKIILLNGP